MEGAQSVVVQVDNRGWCFLQDKCKLGHKQGIGRMGDGR